MTPVTVSQGTLPLVLAFPHVGTFVSAPVGAGLNALGRALDDTDWHVDRLYAGLVPGASTVRANFHRYVIDANRDPAGTSLYPGQNTTTLVPLTTFDGAPIWQTPPDEAEVAARLHDWHAPYHAALAAELERVRAAHGVAVLFDGHSIRSRIPFLFAGRLPDLNLGTADGQSCDASLQSLVAAHCGAATDYSHVINGRFKGGWTTRHYGRPEKGIHAIQLELAQSTYLADETAPYSYDQAKAEALRKVLGTVLHALVAAAPELTSSKGQPA